MGEILFKSIFLFIIVFQIVVYLQTDYLIKLTNPNQINNKTLEFEIKIKSTGSDFTLTSYQCAFTFDLQLGNSDTISLNYLKNTSELANSPVYVIGHDISDGTDKLIFVSGIGNDQISSKEELIGRFQITSNKEFTEELLNLKWNFNGTVNTILTDSNFADITNPSCFINLDNSITSVSNTETISDEYTLSQNYPNPFNPSTKIEYSIPSTKGELNSNRVTLKIYNILGKEITTLVNERKQPGNYEVMFDGKQFASGVYFYTLQAGKFAVTKKMILLK